MFRGFNYYKLQDGFRTKGSGESVGDSLVKTEKGLAEEVC
jgi:hypothetical protein